MEAITNDPSIDWMHRTPHSHGGGTEASNGVYGPEGLNAHIGDRPMTPDDIAEAEAHTAELAEQATPGVSGDLADVAGDTLETGVMGGVMGGGGGIQPEKPGGGGQGGPGHGAGLCRTARLDRPGRIVDRLGLQPGQPAGVLQSTQGMSSPAAVLHQSAPAGTTELHRHSRAFTNPLTNPLTNPMTMTMTMTISNDSYLANLSNESLEVLSHFGPEAPFKLNTYACQVEDALMKALKKQQQQAQEIAVQRESIGRVQEVLQAAAQERDALQRILTDPDQLLDYVSRFFGPQGPCPGGAVISSSPGTSGRI